MGTKKEKEETKKEERMELLMLITSFDSSAVSNYETIFKKIEDELTRVKKKKLGKAMYPKLTLRISSHGGEVDVANAIISHMEQLKRLGVEVNTECCGYGYSSGLLVFLHGMKRTFIDKEFTFVMWHQCRLGSAGKLDDVDRYLQFVKSNMWARHEKYFINNTNVTKEIIEERTKNNTDWYINYKEAKKYGIVTE